MGRLAAGLAPCDWAPVGVSAVSLSRRLLKAAGGWLPLTAELYQRWDDAEPTGGYRLPRLEEKLPSWVQAVERALERSGLVEVRSGRGPLPGAPIGLTQPAVPRRILVFGYLPWWLEHAVALGLLLRAQGHQVELAYLPARRWNVDPSRFDRRRQAAYLKSLLGPLQPLLGLRPLTGGGDRLDSAMRQSIDGQSRLDVQYSLQREDLDWEGEPEAKELLHFRRRRNLRLAGAALRLLRQEHYDSVVIPNGSILEFGALYRVVRHLGGRTVTYEFGEQREHLWLAQDAEVMRLPTEALWRERGGVALTSAELRQLRDLYAARRHGRTGDRFGRSWQAGISQGAQVVRERLGLRPDRPMALLCTNVVGDSLALDRQVFTRGMADWLVTTARHFARSDQAQLVVRVHPGEMLGAGHPSVEIVRGALPQLPQQVILVPPESEINTYDLIELAQVGLVYTTTVGMEMAMFGVPAVVCGDTHYRGKGFTDDPASLGEYLDTLTRRLQEPPGRQLPEAQVELAWRYAHRFFFEYPFAFPWHLLHFWQDLEERPLEEVVASEPTAYYARALRALAGEQVDWRWAAIRTEAGQALGPVAEGQADR